MIKKKRQLFSVYWLVRRTLCNERESQREPKPVFYIFPINPHFSFIRAATDDDGGDDDGDDGDDADDAGDTDDADDADDVWVSYLI